MNELTCRGCGQPEHRGECERPNVDKLRAERDAAISEVGKLARELGKQDARIKELEETAITKDEAKRIIDCLPLDDGGYWIHCVGWKDEFDLFHNLIAKLQKIIGGK